MSGALPRQARMHAPSLYHLVEAALAGDETSFRAILGHLTKALIDGGMEAEAVRAWANRVCMMLGLPACVSTLH